MQDESTFAPRELPPNNVEKELLHEVTGTFNPRPSRRPMWWVVGVTPP